MRYLVFVFLDVLVRAEGAMAEDKLLAKLLDGLLTARQELWIVLGQLLQPLNPPLLLD